MDEASFVLLKKAVVWYISRQFPLVHKSASSVTVTLTVRWGENVVMIRWRAFRLSKLSFQKLQTTTQARKSRCFTSEEAFGKAQNRMLHKQVTCIWISFEFEKSRALLFLTFFSFCRFQWTFLFVLLILRDSASFSCFPLKFFAGNWRVAGQYCPTSDCYVAVDYHGRHMTWG